MIIELSDQQAQALATVLGHVGGVGPERDGLQLLSRLLDAQGYEARDVDTRPYPTYDTKRASGVWLKDLARPEHDEEKYEEVVRFCERQRNYDRP